MPEKEKTKIEESLRLSMEEAITAERTLYRARNMIRGNAQTYFDTAIKATQEGQNELIKQFPKEMQEPKKVAEMFPYIRERLGIHTDDK